MEGAKKIQDDSADLKFALEATRKALAEIEARRRQKRKRRQRQKREDGGEAYEEEEEEEEEVGDEELAEMEVKGRRRNCPLTVAFLREIRMLDYWVVHYFISLTIFFVELEHLFDVLLASWLIL